MYRKKECILVLRVYMYTKEVLTCEVTPKNRTTKSETKRVRNGNIFYSRIKNKKRGLKW